MAQRDQWITAAEAADLLRCSRPALTRMVESGVLAASTPGGDLRVRAGDLDALLDPSPSMQVVRKENPWRTLVVPKERTE